MSPKKVVLILFLITLNITVFLYCQDNKEKAKEHYRQGDLYYQQGRYKEAQEEYQKALDLLSNKEEPPQKTTVLKEYRIGLEDVLSINVWQNIDLAQLEVPVRPDGKISCALIGDVEAFGKTIPELTEEVTKRLEEYIKHPKVAIYLKIMGGKKVLLLGEAAGQGIYGLRGSNTILELIAMAGGFTKDSVPSSTVLIREGQQETMVKRLNLSRALKGDLSQNIVLESGDIVFVPKKFIANLNYFMTEVLGPVLQGSAAYNSFKNWNKNQ